jgi:hypothetical protein
MWVVARDRFHEVFNRGDAETVSADGGS